MVTLGQHELQKKNVYSAIFPCTTIFRHKVSIMLHSGEDSLCTSWEEGGGAVNLGHPAAEALQLMR